MITPRAANPARVALQSPSSSPAAPSTQVPQFSSIARAPRWEPDRVVALDARCRGRAMQQWASEVERRYGAMVLEATRAELAPLGARIPDDPEPGAWIPAAAQILATDAVLRHACGGDARRLEDDLLEDARRKGGVKVGAVLMMAGPWRVFRHAEAIRAEFYDVGRAHADVDKTRAILRYAGSPLFGNPTWQLLQLIGHRIVVRLARLEPHILEVETGRPNEFGFEISWE